MLETVLLTATRVVSSAEELRSYMRGRRIEDVDNLHFADLTTFESYRPFSWNRSALQQLINSGALRQMKNSDLVRKTSIYGASSRHLAEDYLLDMEKSAVAEALAMEIVDLIYPNFELFRELTWGQPVCLPSGRASGSLRRCGSAFVGPGHSKTQGSGESLLEVGRPGFHSCKHGIAATHRTCPPTYRAPGI